MEDQPNRFIPNIRAGRTVALLSLSGLILFAIISACGPLSDDDDGDSTSGSLDPDREVIVSTFTPTIEGATPEIVFTQEARQTEAVQTATARAENPDAAATEDAAKGANQPAPPIASQFPTAADGEVLSPPATFLHYNDEEIQSTFGSFFWVFKDAVAEGVDVVGPLTVPFIEVTDFGLTVPTGSEVTMTLEDPGTAGAPESISVTVYDFESTATIPYDQTGTILTDKPYFVPRGDVIKHLEMELDLDDPVIPLDLAPNQYIVYVQIIWPTNPDLPDKTIFVNYAFNVFVE